jgi:3-hydroxyisobutyrate dehydrogenase-like beta-hydroxyacid dehydrogenase
MKKIGVIGAGNMGGGIAQKTAQEGLKEELAHLYEIFSTRDALTGLTSVGRERPKFEGK